MIISASYKTDIPKFYSKWFMDKVDKGYCKMRNPYNSKEYKIDLKNADGFVFWTKDLGPFLDNLNNIDKPFMIQYAINNYPKELEKSVVEKKDAVEHMKIVADKFGGNTAVWRYDPIIDTSLTPYDWHESNFKNLAKELKNTCNEVVISFFQPYDKAVKRLDCLEIMEDLDWSDPDDEVKKNFVYKLAKIASLHNMKFSVCGQREFLDKGIFDAKCIDAERLSKIAGHKIKAKKKGHREGCGCYESKDVGAYDTCPHGCIYCYAVNDFDKAQSNYDSHNYRSDFLI